MEDRYQVEATFKGEQPDVVFGKNMTRNAAHQAAQVAAGCGVWVKDIDGAEVLISHNQVLCVRVRREE